MLFCVDDAAPAVADGFCQSYSRVLRSKGDGTKGLPLALRRRIAANDALYRCACEKWDNPICKK